MGANRLPPHSVEAEASVLGCVLCDAEKASDTIDAIAERVVDEAVFYDLRHRTIWCTMRNLRASGAAVDMLTLTQRLKDSKNFEQVGGRNYLLTLPDLTPSALNLPTYLDVVVEKWIARTAVGINSSWAGRVWESGHISEGQIAELQRDVDGLAATAARNFVRAPRDLVRPSHFEDDYYACWFKRKQDEYGWPLPFAFPLRIRPSEMTVLAGDNGSGKSSFLGQVSIVLAKAGARPCIASMEVPGDVTLWIMARQLLGKQHLDEDQEGIAQAAAALAWMNSRFWLRDFKGIDNWRDLLDVFRYAQEHYGSDVFIVDSVMRIGIEDDDYATQGLAAARFANFALTTKSHVFLVMHTRKAGGHGGSDKESVRGTKQWSDNAHNVTLLRRNEDKAQKLAEAEEGLKFGAIDQAEYDAKVAKLRKQGDSKFLLTKQRWPGSQQNGSKWLWFHYPSLQFHEHDGQAPFNYLKERPAPAPSEEDPFA